MRDRAPADWLLLHNIEIPRGADLFEVDLIVLTGHSVVVIDVKGTRGRIEVSGQRWFPRAGRRSALPWPSCAAPPGRSRGSWSTSTGSWSGSTSTASWCCPPPTPSWSTRAGATPPTSPTCPPSSTPWPTPPAYGEAAPATPSRTCRRSSTRSTPRCAAAPPRPGSATGRSRSASAATARSPSTARSTPRCRAARPCCCASTRPTPWPTRSRGRPSGSASPTPTSR
ncbi:nuclease-related domain-containing protein [Nonomuraea recticatena]|uniref:nuclease-related domain-containing protein n=1 Tax=Nonomuraea recticatena TaxID=46178 RepID=UPI003608E9EE